MKLILAILFLLLIPTSTAQAQVEEPVAGISVVLEQSTPEQLEDAIKQVIFKQSELEVLYRIVEAEATGQSIEAKKNVASVIVNRVHSDLFLSRISKVVFEKSQFEPITDGRYWEVEITEETICAVNEVVEKGAITEALYFANLKYVSWKMRNWFEGLDFLFKDDSGQSFFK